MFQLHKFIAKLRLLDHGLIGAADEIDDIKFPRKDHDSGNKLNEEHGEDKTEDEEETERIIADIKKYVYEQLILHHNHRDNYKDSLVYQARKEVITKFFKDTTLKKCTNEGCRACVV